MSVTIKELAKIAGISHTVVSGVLNNRQDLRISEETRNKILKLSCEHDCRPNRIARKLRGGDMNTVFILTRVHPTPGHSLLVKEAAAFLEKNNYQVFMAQTASPEQTARQISEIRNFGCSGILSCYTHYVPEPQSQVPMVVVSDYTDVPHDLGIDREYGVEMLTEHLAEHGHKRLCFACCGQWGVKEMQSGFKKALEKYGLEFREDWQVDFLFNQKATEQLLHIIRNDKITGIVCASDFIAGRLLAVLRRQGIQVPSDVAVTGADAMSFSEFTITPLTTVLYPYRLLGRTAAGMLYNRIKGIQSSEDSVVHIKPKLHIAGSCGCINHGADQMLGTVPVFSLEEQIENEENWLFNLQ